MKFDDLMSHLQEFDFNVSIGPRQGRALYNFVLENKLLKCLELGFGHGTSSCFIAAALDELNEGHLTSVDLVQAREWQHPSIEELLRKTNLYKYVTVERENTSYTWFLKKEIGKSSTSISCQPSYDFCFIDGAKHWTIDGFSFFLVDKLLKENGWILFDDFKWNRLNSINKRNKLDYISFLEMGEDELRAAHIELVFRLLVMQHSNYSEFKIDNNNWAYAHKVNLPQKSLVIDQSLTYKVYILRIFQKLERIIRKLWNQD